jgi:hypothetical protein
MMHNAWVKVGRRWRIVAQGETAELAVQALRGWIRE